MRFVNLKKKVTESISKEVYGENEMIQKITNIFLWRQINPKLKGILEALWQMLKHVLK